MAKGARRQRLAIGCAFAAGVAILAATVVVRGQTALDSFVVVGAQLVDGTGAPPRLANVRVVGGRIAGVGDLQPRKGETIIDGTARVIAPGFIDVHNHSTRAIESHPLAESQVSQGITTILVGQDGSSPLPIAAYLEARAKNRAALNVATCVGHATVRGHVMGDDYKRPARPDEVAKMEALVDQGFRDGALCLSSGLEYEVGGYATTDEVVALARVAARHGGFYISHIRPNKKYDDPASVARRLAGVAARRTFSSPCTRKTRRTNFEPWPTSPRNAGSRRWISSSRSQKAAAPRWW